MDDVYIIGATTAQVPDSTSEQCNGKSDNKNCTECSYRGQLIQSITFCEECEKHLCDGCTKTHKSRKTTSNHNVIDKIRTCLDTPSVGNNDIIRTGWHGACSDLKEDRACIRESHTLNVIDSPITQKDMTPDVTCDVCNGNGSNKPASRFCWECNQNLCNGCVKEHKRRKATSKHALSETRPNSQHRRKEMCDVCQDEGKESVAIMKCGICDEKLCKTCTEQHRKLKATQAHRLSDLSKVNSTSAAKMCDVCLEENEHHISVLFCDVCEEYLCQPCVDKHRKRKATASHSLTTPNSLYSDDDHVGTPSCSLCESVKKRRPAATFCPDCDQFFCVFCSTQHTISKISCNHKTIQVEKITEQTKNLECDCCKVMSKSKPATRYCQDCESKLCEKCSNQHTSFPNTKTHNVVSSFEMVTKLVSESGRCEVCRQNNNLNLGKSFCKDCRLILCRTCVCLHAVQKKTKLHTLVCLDEIEEETDSIDNAESKQKLSDKSPSMPTANNAESKQKHSDKSPSMPTAQDVSTSSITITWQKPATLLGQIINYDIRFKEEGEPKWRMKSTEKEQETKTIADLKCDTPYQFKVRAVYADEDGPDSPVSEIIRTNISLARKVIGQSVAVSTQQKPYEPKIYKIPIREKLNCRNNVAKTRKCVFGERKTGSPEKTIMVIGATGAGKSILIDGMINYILDVSWEDDFRFTTIDLMEDEKNKDQTKSQTEWITSYTINPTSGSQIYYTLNIIDTPGFGDTRGIERDHQIVDQIRELFNTRGEQGVNILDAVCFVTQAPLARLSATQKYIIDSILSIFGRDITGNIFALITFADGKTPPVLEALKTANVPIVDNFIFNNSALFTQNQNVSESSFSPMFWKMGKESFKTFFKHLDKVEARSLQLTSEVLNERKELETLVKGLRPQIDEGLQKLETLRQENSILQQHQADITNNRNFTYEVDQPCTKRVELQPGVHVTNCLTCNRTCHDNCALAEDRDKKRCSAMSNGYCRICPGGCIWSQHANNPYKYEYCVEKKRGTYEDLKRKYEDALGGASKQRSVIQVIKDEFNQLSRKVGKMVKRMRSSINRLSEIALKPNPLSDVQYIDLLIESEKQEKKPGFEGRLTMLTQLRKDAQIVQNLPSKECKPFGDIDLDDIVEVEFKPFGDIDLDDIVEVEEKPKGIVSRIKGYFKS